MTCKHGFFDCPECLQLRNEKVATKDQIASVGMAELVEELALCAENYTEAEGYITADIAASIRHKGTGIQHQ